MSAVAEIRAGHAWTDAEGAQARRMRIGGETVDAIARHLGRSSSAVKTYLSLSGTRVNVASMPFTTRDAARERAGKGWWHTRIAIQVGIDVSAVDEIVRRFGVIPPPIPVLLDKKIMIRIPIPPAPPPSAAIALPPMPRRAKRVLGRVTAATGVPVDAILGTGRQAATVVARAAVVYWLRRHGYSYPRIGRMLDLDHTTCVTAARRHVERRAGQGRTLLPVTPPARTKAPA